ncbi:hypothetical protein B0A52_02155 [Exophiala mesophila]|uniref:Xylanolytic transcriptional activator regulatory domain-containing protein n=1 Tax=Exophiala mesophila TaxID=212818 RepID=A0A438NB74_EXOME|nr:hypothetical protein B0A52_02155 [Exophiala mesophila]
MTSTDGQIEVSMHDSHKKSAGTPCLPDDNGGSSDIASGGTHHPEIGDAMGMPEAGHWDQFLGDNLYDVFNINDFTSTDVYDVGNDFNWHPFFVSNEPEGICPSRGGLQGNSHLTGSVDPPEQRAMGGTGLLIHDSNIVQTPRAGKGASIQDTSSLRPSPALPPTPEPWNFSEQEYRHIKTTIDNQKYNLSSNFVLPTHQALARYIEGYFVGWHENLPFLHPPTLSLANASPCLVLGIAAIGARHRYQQQKVSSLYQAAKTIVLHNIRQWQDNVSSPEAITSEYITREGSSDPAPDLLSAEAQCNYRLTPRELLETTQALLMLVVLSSWNDRALIRDALSLGSDLAMLFRQNVLRMTHIDSHDVLWSEWVHFEGARRIKWASYCFLNLLSTVYNVAPMMMNSEMDLFLPRPENEWKATSAHDWQQSQRTNQEGDLSFLQELSTMLSTDKVSNRRHSRSKSAFGHFILIHGLLQKIFFDRQSALCMDPRGNSTLSPEIHERIQIALRLWHDKLGDIKQWENNNNSSDGQIRFNSMAMFLIAHVRLHTDIGSRCLLEQRDFAKVARDFANAPLLPRTPQLCQAVMYTAKSLGNVVRTGVEFVAKTRSLTWSIVQCLSNLECAFLLSKWLQTLAMAHKQGQIIETYERNIVSMVKSIINDIDAEEVTVQGDDDSRSLYKLSSLVIRLWAVTFEGSPVHEITGVIGEGLKFYSKMLESDNAEA